MSETAMWICPDLFLCDADIMAMTHEELGVYFGLLCFAASESPDKPVGCLRNDDKWLSGLARLRRDRWRRIKPVIMRCFRVIDGGRLLEHAKPACVSFGKKPNSTIRPEPKRKPTVYFVQAGDDGPIKIGFTDDLPRRISSLQTAHSKKLRCIAAVSGTVEDEISFHQRFEKHRLRGEWFHPHPDILSFANEVNELEPVS